MGLGAGGLYYMTNKQSSQRGHDVLASVDQHTGRVAMEKKALNLRGLAIPAAAGLGGAGLGALLASRVQSERYEPSRMPMGAGAVYGPRYALEEFADDAGDAEDEAALQEALAELQESGAVYDPYDEMVYKGASDRGRQRARVFAEELSKLASAALDTMVEGGLISPQVAAEFGQSHDISKLANVFYAYGTAAAVADAAEDPT
jgi:nucleotide-binding universal stress UspA family protein